MTSTDTDAIYDKNVQVLEREFLFLLHYNYNNY